MESAANSSDATILVVDDSEANRALARHALEDEGYTVVLASGGAEAIEAFEQSPADCVVLDVRMPGVDGFAVCKRIRSLPGGAEAPVLFLTALRDVDTFDRALLAGGDDFLTKPVRPSELLVRVQTALKLRRMGAELRGYYDLLKHQRDDLLRVQLQKERLMAFVVHDLKNPVNAMDLHAQLILTQPGVSAQTRDSAAQIRSAGRQLERMILNLLDISKADEGKLAAPRSEVDLRSLVEEVFAELELSVRSRQIGLTTSLDRTGLWADRDLLRRTLANLVENAIRHTPAKSEVRVASKAHEGGIEIRVADAGRGVPAELRERIFEPFVQLEGFGAKANRAGRGLGLTFCRLAVEAQGGTIAVESGDPGAVFVLWIPDGP